MNQLAKADKPAFEQAIIKTSPQFNKIRGTEDLVFQQERRFFAMHVNQSKSLQEGDPTSMADAFLQAAGLGLTLNPAVGHCYLIPRRARKKEDRESWDDYNKNVPVLVYPSPGYRGLLHLAEEAGAILWAHADVVCANDVFKYRGTTVEPLHEFDVFKPRGSWVGVYVTVKTQDGSYLTEFMDAAQVERVRKRSEAPESLMWKVFPEEGWKKAVIRRAQKTWPKISSAKRYQQAVEMLNKYEGLDPARTDVQDATGSPAPEALVVISEPQHTELHAMIVESGRSSKEADKWLQRLGRTFDVVRIQDLPADRFDEAKAKLRDTLANNPAGE